MRCSACYGEIPGGTPMLVVYVAIAGERPTERFTGVAWHPACVPGDGHERAHLADDCAEVARRFAERSGARS